MPLAPFVGRAPQGTTWGQHLQGVVWGLTALTLSLFDWPLRKVSGGRLAGTTRAVRSSTAVRRPASPPFPLCSAPTTAYPLRLLV